MSRIFFIFLIPLILCSCKKPPVTVSNQASAQEYSDFAIDEIDFTYFTSKAKIHFKDQHNDLKANGHIRMKKDSLIWMSINAAAGFEAMRVMITKDSVHVLDRMNNKYSVYDFNSLSQKLNVRLSFDMVQAMILGNLMWKREKEDKVTKPDSIYYLLNQTSEKVLVKNYVNIGSRKIEKVDITENGQSNQFTIKYSNFVPLGIFMFPSSNEINLSYTDDNTYQTSIQVEHNKPECPDKEVNFPFNVPNKFTRN